MNGEDIIKIFNQVKTVGKIFQKEILKNYSWGKLTLHWLLESF